VQRIEHLGLEVEDVVRVASGNGSNDSERAAGAFLGESEAGLAARLDEEWRRTVAPEWRQHYKEAEQARARLTELEGRADALSPEEMKERAHMAAVFRPPEEALPLVRALVEEVPEDAGAHFRLGELSLAQGDERGLVSLDRAMELEPQAILPGCELAFSFLFDKGRAEEAEAYRRRANNRADVLAAAEAERTPLAADGPFAPHMLNEETVEALSVRLAGVPKLKRAYLVRKPMQHLDAEFPLHVLVLKPRGLRNRQKLIEDADMKVHFSGWLLCPRKAKLKRMGVDRVPGAKIFDG
jgi:hypothetical protein